MNIQFFVRLLSVPLAGLALVFALPCAAFIPLPEEEEPPAAVLKPLKVDAGAVQAMLRASAEGRANAYVRVAYPLPDGSRRELVFRSFVPFQPGALHLNKEDDKAVAALKQAGPAVQWLASVAAGGKAEPQDVISLWARDGRLSGRASFNGWLYELTFSGSNDAPSVTYRVTGRDTPAARLRRPDRLFGGMFKGDVLVVDLALEADWPLLSGDFGGDLNAVVDALLDQVGALNAIYFRDLQSVFRLTFLGVENVAPGQYQFLTKFGGTEIPVTGLERFRDDWNQNRADVPRDLTVLVSGNAVISATTGVAVGLGNPGALCDQEQAYALTTYSSDANEMTHRLAHEIGHVFGAHHTNCTPDPDNAIGFVDGCVEKEGPACFQGPPVMPAGPGTIMSLCTDHGALRFHEVMQGVLKRELDNKLCLEPASLTLLTNDMPETGLSNPVGHPLYFAIDVPHDVVEFRVSTSGGSGDVDLVVQRRTLNVFASWSATGPGTTKDLVFSRANARPGRWYIGLEPGQSSYNGVELVARYVDAVDLPVGTSRTETDVPAGTWLYYKVEVMPGSVGQLCFTATSSVGAFAFYASRGVRPDPENPAAHPLLTLDDDSLIKELECIDSSTESVINWYLAVEAHAALPDLTVTAEFR
jgi:Metallo-peptidase family M12